MEHIVLGGSAFKVCLNCSHSSSTEDVNSFLSLSERGRRKKCENCFHNFPSCVFFHCEMLTHGRSQSRSCLNEVTKLFGAVKMELLWPRFLSLDEIVELSSLEPLTSSSLRHVSWLWWKAKLKFLKFLMHTCMNGICKSSSHHSAESACF